MGSTGWKCLLLPGSAVIFFFEMSRVAVDERLSIDAFFITVNVPLVSSAILPFDPSTVCSMSTLGCSVLDIGGSTVSWEECWSVETRNWLTFSYRDCFVTDDT